MLPGVVDVVDAVEEFAEEAGSVGLAVFASRVLILHVSRCRGASGQLPLTMRASPRSLPTVEHEADLVLDLGRRGGAVEVDERPRLGLRRSGLAPPNDRVAIVQRAEREEQPGRESGSLRHGPGETLSGAMQPGSAMRVHAVATGVGWISMGFVGLIALQIHEPTQDWFRRLPHAAQGCLGVLLVAAALPLAWPVYLALGMFEWGLADRLRAGELAAASTAGACCTPRLSSFSCSEV